MDLSIEACATEKDLIDAKSSILPAELNKVLPPDYNFGYVYEGKEVIGVVMWHIKEERPTSIGIAPWVGQTEKGDAQNLYIRADEAKKDIKEVVSK